MYYKKTALTIFLAASLSLAGCASTPASIPSTGSETTPAASAQETASPVSVKEMPGTTLAEKNNSKEKDTYLLIDVRSPEEYSAGHIPHAINLPVDTLNATLAAVEDYKDKPLVLYCNTGKKSAKAADILIQNGFKDVSNAQGVKDHTYDLVTYTDLRAKDLLKKREEEPDSVLVDYRPEKDFNEGHLQGAVHVPLGKISESADKLPKQKTILLYCNTGTQSAKAAKELQDLGYDKVFNSVEGVKEYPFELVKD